MATEKKVYPQSCSWCFTIALGYETDVLNGTASTWEPFSVDEMEEADVRFIKYSLEVGDGSDADIPDGLYHYQGYICFNSKQRMRHVKKSGLGCNWAHLEIMRGSIKENDAYVEKDPILGPFEWGLKPTQGKRSDLIHCKHMLERGEGELALYKHHFGTMARYRNGVMRYAQLLQEQEDKPPRRKVSVYVTYGEPGTSKTFTAYEYDPNLYSKNLETKWWDKYDGQKTLLLDDFVGQIGIQVCRVLYLTSSYTPYRS